MNTTSNGSSRKPRSAEGPANVHETRLRRRSQSAPIITHQMDLLVGANEYIVDDLFLAALRLAWLNIEHCKATGTIERLVELIRKVYDGKSPLILHQFRLYVVPKLFLRRPTKVSMISEESWNRKSQNLQQMILESSWRDFRQLARCCVIKVTN